jgi:predicted  nucleic acid-binding Zn-ribbon protein
VFLEERLSDVEKLWKLQTVLSQLADREKQMSVKPESFAAIDREYQTANEDMTRLQQQLEVLAKDGRRVDGELADHQELLKKYQGTLMQVKNQQQYAAAWKEIDGTRKQVKELEDARLKNMTEADAIQTQLDERKGGYDDLQGRYDSAHEEWQHSLGDLRSESEALRTKAASIEKSIPERLRSEFHRIAKQRGGIAVAAVSNDACSGCRTRIRPAVVQQLKRGDVVFCENCRRILYLERPTS